MAADLLAKAGLLDQNEDNVEKQEKQDTQHHEVTSISR